MPLCQPPHHKHNQALLCPHLASLLQQLPLQLQRQLVPVPLQLRHQVHLLWLLLVGQPQMLMAAGWNPLKMRVTWIMTIRAILLQLRWRRVTAVISKYVTKLWLLYSCMNIYTGRIRSGHPHICKSAASILRRRWRCCCCWTKTLDIPDGVALKAKAQVIKFKTSLKPWKHHQGRLRTLLGRVQRQEEARH